MRLETIETISSTSFVLVAEKFERIERREEILLETPIQ
jgi:hypothetical protein